MKDLIPKITSFLDSETFQGWVEDYFRCELAYYATRSRFETMENMLARSQFSQELSARFSQKIMEQRFELMDRASRLDEMDGVHNKYLKKFENLRAKCFRLWEKISSEQIKDKPNQRKLETLNRDYESLNQEQKGVQNDLNKIWGQQGVVRLEKELLLWKSQRVQQAGLRTSKKAAGYNQRIARLKALLAKEQERLRGSQAEFNSVKDRLPQEFTCQLLEHFVCFPMGPTGVLYSLIEDNSLFPIPVQRNKIYVVDFESGFQSLKEIDTLEAAA